MNKEQWVVIKGIVGDNTKAQNKVQEFEQKFFKFKEGVLSKDNPRRHKDLSVAVYFGNAGQDIHIDQELLPDVIEFFKKPQDHYKMKTVGPSVGELIDSLNELDDSSNGVVISVDQEVKPIPMGYYSTIPGVPGIANPAIEGTDTCYKGLLSIDALKESNS
jgi:hypothetical protein